MQRFVSRLVGSRGFAALLGATVMAGIGSIAWATIPGGDGIISACYKDRTGVLRVIDAEQDAGCRRNETPISWNQQGSQGEQGVPGAQGEQGEPGPSHGHFVGREYFDVTAPAGGSADVVVASVVVPGGDYLIQGRARYAQTQDDGAGVFFPQCRLIADTGTDETNAPSGGDSSTREHHFMLGLTLNSATTVELRCRHTAFASLVPRTYRITDIAISAIEVGDLAVTQLAPDGNAP